MKMSSRVLIMIVAVVVAATVMAAVEVDATKICGVDTTELGECLPAITGKSPPRPTMKCCRVVRRVDMRCLCQYKPALPALGIDPKNAMALPKRCSPKNPAPIC